jgi:hypothetical protein
MGCTLAAQLFALASVSMAQSTGGWSSSGAAGSSSSPFTGSTGAGK